MAGNYPSSHKSIFQDASHVFPNPEKHIFFDTFERVGNPLKECLKSSQVLFSTFPERTLYCSARTLGLRFYNFFHGSNERCQNLCQISRSRASRTPLQTTFFSRTGCYYTSITLSFNGIFPPKNFN